MLPLWYIARVRNRIADTISVPSSFHPKKPGRSCRSKTTSNASAMSSTQGVVDTQLGKLHAGAVVNLKTISNTSAVCSTN